MAFSTVTYTVPSPVETTYAIPFDFLREGNISVEVNGVALDPTTDYTIAAAWDELDISAVLLAGDLVTITRSTPLTDAGQYVSFTDAAVPRREDLETFRKQHLFIAQENADAATSGLQLDLADSKWDAESRVIKNVDDPSDDQDAATKGWVTTAFATGGVLPDPSTGDPLDFLRINSAGTGYVLATSLGERYLFKIISQGSGPVGYNSGFVLEPYATGFDNNDDQRCPLELVDDFGDIGEVSLAVNTFDLTVGAGQWEIEVNGHLRGLTDTGNTNYTDGQLAITGSTGTTVYAQSPEVITGFAVTVQDSGATITRTVGISGHATVRYLATFGVNTIINLRGKGSTSSHSVVADTPTYLRIQRVTR
jgi:hypothetical protein